MTQRTNGYLIKNQTSKAYNEKVRPQALRVSNLVFKTVGHIQKGLSASKFAPTLEGPYVIREAYYCGQFLISRPDSEDLLTPINVKSLKLYYP